MERKSLVLILGIAFALVAVGVALIVPRLGQAPRQPPVAQDKALTEQIELYEDKVREEPENPAWWAKLGELYFQGGDWDKALENFAKAVELDPQDVGLRIKLAIIYWHSGDIEAGIRQLDEALQLDPSHIAARFYKGILLSTVKGREEEAIAELEEVIRLDPDSELAQRARNRLAELGADVDMDVDAAPSLLPQSLGGLPLQEFSSGEEAIAEINKLHGKELPITDGYVGSYSDGTKSLTLWVAQSESDGPEELLQQMLEALRKGRTPFSAPRRVEGLEREVYSTEGLDQTHYIWTEGNLLIWMALGGFPTDEGLEVLREAIGALVVQGLPSYAHQDDYTLASYIVAVRLPRALELIPCYCGCGGIGHESLKDCFLSEEGFIPHGANCGICKVEAIKTAELLLLGKSIGEVRALIEQEFSSGYGPPTPTPQLEAEKELYITDLAPGADFEWLRRILAELIG